MATEAPLIGTREAASMLGINRATITRWVKSGRLTPVHQLDGLTGALLFKRDDVAALAEEQAA